MTADDFIFGGESAGDTWEQLWVHKMLQHPLQTVFGYETAHAEQFAFLTGEINAFSAGMPSYYVNYLPAVKRGEAIGVYQLGIVNSEGVIVREPAAPDVPTAPQLYEEIYGEPPSGPDWEAYKAIVGPRSFGTCLLAQPDVPADLVAILRQAAIDMVADPKFLDMAERMSPGSIHYVGDGLVNSYVAGIQRDPAILDYVEEYFLEVYDTEPD